MQSVVVREGGNPQTVVVPMKEAFKVGAVLVAVK